MLVGVLVYVAADERSSSISLEMSPTPPDKQTHPTLAATSTGAYPCSSWFATAETFQRFHCGATAFLQ
jgi:hypothetical protein